MPECVIDDVDEFTSLEYSVYFLVAVDIHDYLFECRDGGLVVFLYRRFGNQSSQHDCIVRFKHIIRHLLLAWQQEYIAPVVVFEEMEDGFECYRFHFKYGDQVIGLMQHKFVQQSCGPDAYRQFSELLVDGLVELVFEITQGGLVHRFVPNMEQSLGYWGKDIFFLQVMDTPSEGSLLEVGLKILVETVKFFS